MKTLLIDLAAILIMLGVFTMAFAKQETHATEPAFPAFDIKDAELSRENTVEVSPWKIVQLDPDYGGQWVVAGDLDGDGEVEIVSAENHNEGDIHYTSAAVAQKLDGTVLWRWGDPDIGRKNWHHDVACQIHDWDNDGRDEVMLCTKGALVELDGTTGKERRRLPIPDEATDCLVFCNLTGKDHPSDVLVKTRYTQIWAYNYAGDLLWTVENPGGYRTAHQPIPVDLDGDGRDEIMAGYAMLNADGTVRWVYQSKAVDQSVGHDDCFRVVRSAKTLDAFRLVLTCCGANNIAMVDGNGKLLWEVSGHHFESIDVGRVVSDPPGPQLVVDIDHMEPNLSPIWVLDEHGNRLGRIVAAYCRHHVLLDWDGDGLDEIMVGHDGAVYNGQGKRIATLLTPGAAKGGYEKSILVGDMTGNGIPDVMMAAPNAVFLFKNEKGRKPATPIPLGTEPNFTLY